MSHSSFSFTESGPHSQIEIVVRAVDLVGAVFDNLKVGNISEAVARKALIETILTGECAPTARAWTLLIENHEGNNLEAISVIETDGGETVEMKIGQIDTHPAPGKRDPRSSKRITKKAA